MSITAITIKDNFFYKGTEHWSPKGICYQPTDFVDPISDNNLTTIQNLLDPTNEVGWLKLHINAIRVYQVDPTASHDKVMKLLSDNGIYVLVGAVNNTANVGSPTSQYYQRLHDVADAFCQYDNVMGFSISNEAINPGGGSPGYDIPSKIRAAAKDLRSYMSSKSYRIVPVGMAMRDDPQYTIPAAKAYMAGSAENRVDFLGYNLERWATGPISGKISAYYNFVSKLQGYNPVPVVLTEFGVSSDTLNPRQYKQVPYIYGVDDLTQSGMPNINMADIVSGGFAFRYLERRYGWGLVTPTGVPNPGAGYGDLGVEYGKITSFHGTPNTLGTVPCSSGNPYCSGGTGPSGGGLAQATNVKFTFNIPNATEIVLNYTSNNWKTYTTLAKGVNGDPVASVTVPQGATALQVVANLNGSWPSACVVSDLNSNLTEGCTIDGAWVGNGNGACTIVPAKEVALS